jgi:hypothetical protein
VSLPVRRIPGVFMNVSVWEHLVVNNSLYKLINKYIYKHT